MSDHELSGGCQCGRIRYTACVDDFDAYLCHCRMCQRATGGVSIAFKNLKKASVTWTTQAPEVHASSPIAERGFCNACGTPLTFAFPDSETIDITVGSFDDPTQFVCVRHVGVESRLPAWQATDGLPEARTDENKAIVARWMKATDKLP